MNARGLCFVHKWAYIYTISAWVQGCTTSAATLTSISPPLIFAILYNITVALNFEAALPLR